MARPFQFRLRIIFWLVALVAVLCVAGPRAFDWVYERWVQRPTVRYAWPDGARTTKQLKPVPNR